jgi:hypothetical protein
VSITEENDEEPATHVPLYIFFTLLGLIVADGVPVYSLQFIKLIETEDFQY